MEQPKRSLLTRVVLTASATLAALLLLVAGVWFLLGGRWYMIESPSMGRTAPTGNLVITKPIAYDDIRVGDIITVRTVNNHTRTHRVVEVSPAGLVTRGDLNAANDAGISAPEQVVGKVRWIVPSGGYILQMLPLIVLGNALVWALSVRLRKLRLESATRIIGYPLVFALTSWWVKPWTRIVMLGQHTENGRTTVHLVGTGIFPVNATVKDGTTVYMRGGQVGDAVTSYLGDKNGRIPVAALAHFNWWETIIVVACVLLPLLFSLRSAVYHRRADRELAEAAAAEAATEAVDETEGEPAAGVPRRALIEPEETQVEVLLTAPEPQPRRELVTP